MAKTTKPAPELTLDADAARDAAISAAAAEIQRDSLVWGVAEAKALIAKVGRHPADIAYWEDHGVFPSSNGFPVTQHAGQRIVLAHVLPAHNGVPPRFEKPTQLDRGR